MLTLQNQSSWEMSFWEIPVGITFISLIEIWRLIHCGCYYSKIEILDFVNEGREVSGILELSLCVPIGGVMGQTSSFMLLHLSLYWHAVAWDYAPNKPVSLELLTQEKILCSFINNYLDIFMWTYFWDFFLWLICLYFLNFQPMNLRNLFSIGHLTFFFHQNFEVLHIYIVRFIATYLIFCISNIFKVSNWKC